MAMLKTKARAPLLIFLRHFVYLWWKLRGLREQRGDLLKKIEELQIRKEQVQKRTRELQAQVEELQRK
jgi:predicted nuclease with TOPRIM domain